MRQTRQLTGILFFVLSAQFLLFLMVGESMAPGYNMHDNAISDLGVIKETASLFAFSMVIAGLLNIIGGYLFYQSHQMLGTLILYILAGIGDDRRRPHIPGPSLWAPWPVRPGGLPVL